MADLECECGSEEFKDLGLCDTRTAALKIEFKSEKFGLLLFCCAAIKMKKKSKK